MKGREFVDRVREIGRAREVVVYTDAKRGKGSHITLYYGLSFTTVKDRRKELSRSLLSKMIRDLGLQREDFR